MSRSSSCLNLAMRSLFASTAFAHRFRTPAMAPACAFCASLKTFRQCASRAVARRSSARSFRASASAAAAESAAESKAIEERFEPPPPPSANDARNVDALLRRAFRASRAFRAFGASSRRVSSSAAPVSSVDAAANRVLRAGLPRAAGRRRERGALRGGHRRERSGGRVGRFPGRLRRRPGRRRRRRSPRVGVAERRARGRPNAVVRGRRARPFRGVRRLISSGPVRPRGGGGGARRRRFRALSAS